MSERDAERAGLSEAEVTNICEALMSCWGERCPHTRVREAVAPLADRLAAAVARAEAAEAKVAAVERLVEPQWRPNRGYELETTTDAYAAGRNSVIDAIRAALADVPTSAPTGEAS